MGAGRALVLAIGLATLASGNALAHGTGARVLGTTATTVELYYVGGDPMAYAEAKVFSPEAPDVPFVNGRTDKLGRIAFAANHDGIWHVEAHDTEGHRVQTDVTIAAGSAVANPGIGGHKWLLWGSLTLNILGLVGAVEWWRSRKAKPALALHLADG